MNRFLLSVLLIILSGTYVRAQDTPREVDLRISGVGSGSSYSLVLSSLGKPMRQTTKVHRTFEGDCLGADSTILILDYPGLKVVLLGDGSGKNRRVVEMRMTSGTRSASGIQLGATTEQVRKRFGEPNSIEQDDGTTEFFYVTRGNLGGVKFVFRNGRLTIVGMSETLC